MVQIELEGKDNPLVQSVALSLWRQAEHHYARGNMKLGDLITGMFNIIVYQFNLPHYRRYINYG